VEKEEQRALLKREGCREIQGFLIGRPAQISTYARLTHGVLPFRSVNALAG
jgi:EAL domain-containing protein (putative c-di-GMP-specific phosphodiesterase class I)